MKRKIISSILAVLMLTQIVFATTTQVAESIDFTVDEDEIIETVGENVVLETDFDENAESVEDGELLLEEASGDTIENIDVEQNNSEDEASEEIPDNMVIEESLSAADNGDEEEFNFEDIVEDVANETDESTVNNTYELTPEDIEFFNSIEFVVDENDSNFISSDASDNIEFVSAGNMTIGNFNMINTLDEIPITETAPYVYQSTDIKLDSSTNTIVGLRFKMEVSCDQQDASEEYGFLITRESVLQNYNADLTFDLPGGYVTGVCFDRSEGIDISFMVENNIMLCYGVLTGIPVNHYVSDLVARSYIKYVIDGQEVIVYGNTCTSSIYRSGKIILENEDVLTETQIEIIKNSIDAADNLYSLNNAEVISLGTSQLRTLGESPDVDIVKFTIQNDSYKMIETTGADINAVELLDADGNILQTEVVNNTQGYLFEAGETYYVRLKGDMNADYTLIVKDCIDTTMLAQKGIKANIMINGNVVTVNAQTVYCIDFDPEYFELDDACVFTVNKETTSGEAETAGITIVSVNPGSVKFSLSRPIGKTITGVLNCIGLGGINTGESIIRVSKE